MAWTINPRGRVPLGNGLVIIYGDYSTAGGGETAQYSFGGGYPIWIDFLDANNNTFTSAPNRPTAASTSGTITTLTLTAQSTVTSGGFIIVVLGA